MIAPSGAWASAPRNVASATRRVHVGTVGVHREASHVASVEQDRDPGDEAVRELDLLVVVARRELRRALAAGPFRTAEARRRQAHGRAARDDHDEHQRVRERDPAECPRRDRERAHARQRRRHPPTVAAGLRDPAAPAPPEKKRRPGSRRFGERKRRSRASSPVEQPIDSRLRSRTCLSGVEAQRVGACCGSRSGRRPTRRPTRSSRLRAVPETGDVERRDLGAERARRPRRRSSGGSGACR